MDSISFQIPLKPMTTNHSHRLVKMGRRAGKIRTDDFKLWEREFLYYLNQYGDLRPHLLRNYDERKHCFFMEMFIYVNETKFFAKAPGGARRISKTGGDTTNCIKTAEDQIFRWLGVNDSQNNKILAERIPTNGEPTMVFRISLTPIPELFLVSDL